MLDLREENILITGGNGFIGQHLIKRFLAEKIYPLIGSNQISDRAAKDFKQKKIVWKQLDLLDYRLTNNLLKKQKPTIIIHLAGATLHDDPTGKMCYKLNFEAAENLLESAASINIKRFIIIGSADEYGNQAPPQNEKMPPQPKSDYAKSKTMANAAALKMFHSDQFPAVVLRPFTAFGEGQPEKMFLMQAIKAAIGGQNFSMTEGRQKRDFVYVADVADAIFRAAYYPQIEGKTINIASGQATALREIAKLVWQITGASAESLQIGKRPLPAGENHDTEADITLAGKLLDWSPQTSLECGLQRMIDSVKSSF